MGTRHLIMVVKDRITKVAQYGQFDGYPEGQGIYILNFLKNIDINRFNIAVEKLRWLSKDELANIQSKHNYIEEYPYLKFTYSAKILELIYYKNGKLALENEEMFAASVFCEWGYVIDLDANTFEVYKGFNQKKLNDGDRFFSFMKYSENGYYPIKLAVSFNLYDLPEENEFYNSIKCWY